MVRTGLWWAAWGFFAVLRSALLVLCFRSGNPLLVALCVPETVALVFGVVNPFVAKDRFATVGGLAVPALYLFGFFLIPAPPAGSGAGYAGISLLAAGLSAWALWCLGPRFSIGGASWVGLCDTGPYRIIRHPQQASRCLVCAGVLVALVLAGDLGSAGRAALALAAAVVCVLAEESDLGRVPEWVEYRERVPWRLLPGFW